MNNQYWVKFYEGDRCKKANVFYVEEMAMDALKSWANDFSQKNPTTKDRIVSKLNRRDDKEIQFVITFISTTTVCEYSFRLEEETSSVS